MQALHLLDLGQLLHAEPEGLRLWGSGPWGARGLFFAVAGFFAEAGFFAVARLFAVIDFFVVAGLFAEADFFAEAGFFAVTGVPGTQLPLSKR